MPPKAKRKVKRKQHGKGPAEIAGKVLQLLKDTKAISKTINAFAPENSIAQSVSGAADQLGYGRVHAMHGTGFSDIMGSILGGIGGGLGKGVNATLGGLFGGGRRAIYQPVR